MHLAAMNPDSNVLQYLLKTYPLMVKLTDQFGMTALHCACSEGILQNVKLLLECPVIKSLDAGDNEGDSPLHRASHNGHEEVVNYILSISKAKSIDIKKVNNFGETAEDCAKREGHTEVLKIFEIHHFLFELSLL